MTTSRSDNGRSRLYWAIGLLALAVVIAVVVLLSIHHNSNEQAPRASVSPAAQPSPAPTPTGVAALPPQRQRALASIAALGRDGSVAITQKGNRYLVAPAKLIDANGTPVLITTQTNADDCHACSGALGIYYLKPVGDRFAVVQRYPGAIEGSDNGVPPDNWKVSGEFGGDPIIYAQRGGAAQGYRCTRFTLTALTSSGPKQVADVPLSFSNRDAVIDPGTSDLHGEITDIVPGQSFAVHYSGTQRFTDSYTLRNGRYQPAHPIQMRTC